MNVNVLFRPVFRSYQPLDDALKEHQLPKVKPVEGKNCSSCKRRQMLFEEVNTNSEMYCNESTIRKDES
jgi:hypothetical protein